jgi:AraC-like DNA-binding protein
MNTISDIGLITVFLMLLLAGFLFSHSSKRKEANALFAFFLLVTSFDISALFLSDFYATHSVLNQLRVASVFLQMPFFYFYVKKACFNDFKLHAKLLLHAFPFLGFAVVFLGKVNLYQIDLWYMVSAQAQYYVYMALTFGALHKYKKTYNEGHSLQNETYRWLMTTSILFLTGNIFVLFRGVFEALNDFESLSVLNLGISLFGLFVISWFVLKTMRNPELFTSVNEMARPSGNYEKESFSEEIAQLHAFMNTHKPYLEEALTLQELSEKTNIPSKHLSFLINQIIGKHFFDFINAYRIEAAKRLLKESDFTIQQIMYEVGFNSKSSFNTAFKKNTSLTPSGYRKEKV